MKFSWVLGIMLLTQTQTASLPDDLSIEHDGRSIASVNRSEYQLPFPEVPLVDGERFTQLLEKLDRQTYIPPMNAYIGESGRVIAEKPGKILHRKAFTDIFYTYFYSNGPAKIEIPILPVYPRVDRDLISHIRVKMIGQYVTYFNPNNASRSHNIQLAAEALDNYVVFPNEVFSFNRAVGKRTAGKGYKRAPVIVRGELSEDIGGGICQVSSTLFNAVDRAGVKVIERYSHSKKVPYVPPGRDATVSWYGPDFTFRNRYSSPLLIRAKAMHGQVVIRVYSSDEIDYEPRQVPKASTMLPEEISIEKEAVIED
ncbi:VanW family protein [Bacillus sp. NTK034]|uniref:VanW family protein n=1 Tax=Bacillus sp. NTK034 TaxID=2802176 RepID=UPI001A90A03B|nr:VanW family protein [Bacillus sp. NTK034]MBN8202347.1 VanW family protein [Bacillus sp. NTK034]